MNPPVAWSVAGIVSRLIDHQLTAAEIVETSLTRIESSQPIHNAFISLSHEGARRDAARIGKLVAHEPFTDVPLTAPLSGVPVGVKDVFDVAGLPTTAGSALFADNIASADGPVAQILRRAGAIVVGKTNMDEFAFGPNQHAFGRTSCPADTTRYAGGSSAGSAAAVAAGLVPIAIGTDAGGSVRYPAACCGVVGFKPTFGRIPHQGTIPRLWSLDHIGFLGSNVADVAAVYDVFAPDSPRLPPGQAHAQLTFGILSGWADLCTPAVRVPMEAALASIQVSGGRVLEIPAIDSDPVFAALLTTVSTEAAASLFELLNDAQLSDVAPGIRVLLEAGRSVSGIEYLAAQRFRSSLRSAIDRALLEVDALLTPTITDVARRWDAPDLADWSIARFLPAFNLSGHPAISIPVPGPGLPVGLQLVGRRRAEAALLSAATWCEATLAPWADD